MALAVAATAAAAPTRSPVPRAIEAAPNAPFAPGEAIVRFEPGTGPSDRRSARNAARADFERGIAIPRAQVVAVDGAVKAAIQRLERQPDIAYAQPNYRYEAHAVDAPNDTFFDDLWGLENTGQDVGSGPSVPGMDVDALAAWEATQGAGQVIAVLDTGVDLAHPDLMGNLWANPGEVEDGADGDDNGRVDDVHGYDFVDGDGDPDDYNDHGTHVAGTAAAVAGNALGVAGVAPEAEVMAVRVLDGDGRGLTSEIAAGIKYAAAEGADAVNLSLGGPAGQGDQTMADAVADARAHGAVVVAAAGNEGLDNDVKPHSPCVLPEPTQGVPLDNLICVAAVDSTGDLASSSNWGSNWGSETVHVGAPGVEIRSSVTDYITRYRERFESGIVEWSVESPWGVTDERSSEGSHSFADSPGGPYLPDVDSQAVGPALDLSSDTGCRMRFDVRLRTEPATDGADDYADRLIAGVRVDSTVHGVQLAWDRNQFFFVEFQLDEAAGDGDARPVLWFQSDGNDERDGAHVDDLRLICRDDVYEDDDYWRFSGTSMATPHVAGVVALAGAAADDAGRDASAQAIVDAVLAGVNPLDDLDGKTVKGGMVDACLAIGEARGTPGDCSTGGDTGNGGTGESGSGDDGGSATPSGGGTPTTDRATGERAPAPLARPNLRRSPRQVRVRRSGRFAYAFLAPRGVRGAIALRTARRVRVHPLRRARRQVRIAFRRFAVGDRRRVVLRFRLSPRERRILRLNRRLVLRVIVKVRDAPGQTATARKRLRLLAPRGGRRR